MTKTEVKSLSFEQAVGELESIVAQLENGEQSLEQSVELFERGLRLSQVSQEKLTQAELKIAQLVQKDGQQQLEPFELTGANEE